MKNGLDRVRGSLGYAVRYSWDCTLKLGAICDSQWSIELKACFDFIVVISESAEN